MNAGRTTNSVRYQTPTQLLPLICLMRMLMVQFPLADSFGRKLELEDAGPFHHGIGADPGLRDSPVLPSRAPRRGRLQSPGESPTARANLLTDGLPRFLHPVTVLRKRGTLEQSRREVTADRGPSR